MEGTADRVLAAALPLFVTPGYAGASLEKVRRDAGVSNGSLYHHFPRRADLAAHLLNEGMRQCQDAVLAVVTGGGAAEQGGRAGRAGGPVRGHRAAALGGAARRPGPLDPQRPPRRGPARRRTGPRRRRPPLRRRRRRLAGGAEPGWRADRGLVRRPARTVARPGHGVRAALAARPLPAAPG